MTYAEKPANGGPTGRVAYLDIARAIAIFLVILGHVVAANTFAKQVLYAFHMPLFFMLSGMVLKPEKAEQNGYAKEQIAKRALTLLVPYVLWGLIYAPFSGENVLRIAYGSREMLKAADSLTSLWFLPVMFLSSVICVVVLVMGSKFQGKHRTAVIATWMVMLCLAGFIMPHQEKLGDPFGCDVAFMAAAFMLMGYFLRQVFCRIGDGVGLYLAIAVCLGVFCATLTSNVTSKGYVLMANAVYGNPALFLAAAIGGGVCVIGLSILIARIDFARTALCGIGQRTLGIFLVHKPLVYFMRDVVKGLGLSYNDVPIAIAASLTVLAISFLIVCIIERILPEAVGAKRKSFSSRAVV